MELKTCTKCGIPKPLDDFGKKKLGRGGKDPWCKLCHRTYQNAMAPLYRERKNRISRAKYHSNPKQLEANRAWRKANPEQSRELSRKWRAANKHKVKARQQRWNKNIPVD